MRLTEFIRTNQRKIIGDWETFARTLLPAAGTMNSVALRDHAGEILDAIVEDMETPQTAREQTAKSKGKDVQNTMRSVGKIHAILRIETGFKLDQVVAEYRALRASVLRLWQRNESCDMGELIRFNESIDEALTEATTRFTEAMDGYRDRFVGILGHDLRNPLGAIIMTAGRMAKSVDIRQAADGTRIVTSAVRMNRMVGDLLDLTQSQLHGTLPMTRAPMDLAPLCRQIVGEIEALHADRTFRLRLEGDLTGDWDSDRLAQLLSNLVGNCVQHGFEQTPISIMARATNDYVTIDVHNEGGPIPEDVLPSLFEPFVRGSVDEKKRSNSLGLGLYIAKQIAVSHGGDITVSSTEGKGTTFSVGLPRWAPSGREPTQGDRSHISRGNAALSS